jgi:hypothetical protein
MPELLSNVLAEHAYDPVRLPFLVKLCFADGHSMQIPISLTVQKCASNFKKTHQDTWHEDSKALHRRSTCGTIYATHRLIIILYVDERE